MVPSVVEPPPRPASYLDAITIVEADLAVRAARDDSAVVDPVGVRPGLDVSESAERRSMSRSKYEVSWSSSRRLKFADLQPQVRCNPVLAWMPPALTPA
jgi:hypothetical protein